MFDEEQQVTELDLEKKQSVRHVGVNPTPTSIGAAASGPTATTLRRRGSAIQLHTAAIPVVSSTLHNAFYADDGPIIIAPPQLPPERTSPLGDGDALAKSVGFSNASRAVRILVEHEHAQNDFQTAWADHATATGPSAVLKKVTESQLSRLREAWMRTTGATFRQAQPSMAQLMERAAEDGILPTGAGSVNLDDFMALLAPLLIHMGDFTAVGDSIALRGERRSTVLADMLPGLMSPSDRSIKMAQSSYQALDLAAERLWSDDSDLACFLRDLFLSIDLDRTGLVSWESFVTFVIERAYGHTLDLPDDQSRRAREKLEFTRTVEELSSAMSTKKSRKTTVHLKGGLSSYLHPAINRASKDTGHNHTQPVEDSSEVEFKVNPVTGTRSTLQYKGSFAVPQPIPVNRPHWVRQMRFFQGWNAISFVDYNVASVMLLEDFDRRTHSGPEADVAAVGHANDEAGGAEADFGKESEFDRWKRMRAKRHLGRALQTSKQSLSGDISSIEEASAELASATKQLARTMFARAKGMILAAEYLPTISAFATICNATSEQLTLHAVHGRAEMGVGRSMRVPLSGGDDNAVTALRSYHKPADCVDPDARLARLSETDEKGTLLLGTRKGAVLMASVFTSMLRKGGGLTAAESNSIPIADTRASVHTGDVTEFLVLPRTGRFVSCGLDGRVLLHEIEERGIMGSFAGHQKGVYLAEYCNAFELFLTGGFEFRALCWAENLPKCPAFELADHTSPHAHPLAAIVCVDGTPQVYTVDHGGIAKLFDVRSLKCLDSWRAFDTNRVSGEVSNEIRTGALRGAQHMGDIGSVCYTGSAHRSMLFAARRVHAFNTEVQNADAERAHDLSEPMVNVDVGRRAFVTATAQSVKSWSVKDGTEQHQHHTARFCTAPVTIVRIDSTTNRVFTGHSNGAIIAFNAQTSVLCRRFIRHEAPVRTLEYDGLNGVLISSSLRGDFFVWDDVDRVTNPWTASSHVQHLYGHESPVPAEYTRHSNALFPPKLVDRLVRPVPAHVRMYRIATWVICRWRRFSRRRTDAKMAERAAISKAHAGIVGGTVLNGPKVDKTDVRFVTTTLPAGQMFVKYPIIGLAIAPRFMMAAALSTKSNCRIVDYSHRRPLRITYRLFHGADRELIAVALLAERGFVAVTDVVGAVYIWMLRPEEDDNALEFPLPLPSAPALLLCKFLNRCQVMTYSHPMKELGHTTVGARESVWIIPDDPLNEPEIDDNDLRAVEEMKLLEERDGVAQKKSLPTPTNNGVRSKKKWNELNLSSSSFRGSFRGDSSGISSPPSSRPSSGGSTRSSFDGRSGTTTPRTPRRTANNAGKTLAALPTVTSVLFDRVRFALVTGDDVGFISIYDLDTLYQEVGDHSVALLARVPTGCAPRFITSWRGHEYPIAQLRLMPHSMHCIVSSAIDNIVALWAIDGTWVAGLRQGPIVHRVWRFPSHAIATRAVLRQRIARLREAVKSGTLVKLYRTKGNLSPVSKNVAPPFSRVLVEALAHRRTLHSVAHDIAAAVSAVKHFHDEAEAHKQEQAWEREWVERRENRFAKQLHPHMRQTFGAAVGEPNSLVACSTGNSLMGVEFSGEKLLYLDVRNKETERSGTTAPGHRSQLTVIEPEFNVIGVARSTYEENTRKVDATSSVAVALKRAFTVTNTVDTSQPTVECSDVIGDDPLRAAQLRQVRTTTTKMHHAQHFCPRMWPSTINRQLSEKEHETASRVTVAAKVHVASGDCSRLANRVDGPPQRSGSAPLPRVICGTVGLGSTAVTVRFTATTLGRSALPSPTIPKRTPPLVSGPDVSALVKYRRPGSSATPLLPKAAALHDGVDADFPMKLLRPMGSGQRTTKATNDAAAIRTTLSPAVTSTPKEV